MLLRLGRFALPYHQRLMPGFALTLASTAATQVPPYLTIPLTDKVLLRFRRGSAGDAFLAEGRGGHPLACCRFR